MKCGVRKLGNNIDPLSEVKKVVPLNSNVK
jgi:hypothetical protein